MEDLYMAAVKQNGIVLYNVPEEHRTSELCKEAVKQNGMAIKFVPEELMPELRQEIKQDGRDDSPLTKEDTKKSLMEKLEDLKSTAHDQKSEPHPNLERQSREEAR